MATVLLNLEAWQDSDSGKEGKYIHTKSLTARKLKSVVTLTKSNIFIIIPI